MPTLEDIAKAKDAKGHGSNAGGGNPFATHKIPALSGWSMSAGGTAAAAGKHGYSHTAPGGRLANGVMQYRIEPVSHSNGRHSHYQLSVAGHPDSPGLHQHLGNHSHPAHAAKAAREHYEGGARSTSVKKLADIVNSAPARTLGALFKRKDAKGHGSDKKDEKPGSKSPFAIADVPGHDAFVATRPGGTHHQISHSYGDDIIDMHHEGGNAYREGKYGTPFPANDHLDAAKKVLDRRKVEYDRGEQERNRREHERKHGNEYTGDITGLHQHMHVHNVRENWVEGSTPDGNHKVHLKVYNEGSKFGIGGGRVSKLEMREPYGNTVVNYDRGWDVRPKTPEHKEFVRNVTRTLGGKLTKSVDGDELWADAEGPAMADPGPLQKRAVAPAEGGPTE